MTERESHRKTERDHPDPLNQPLDRGPNRRLKYDPERFGRLSEGVARYIGSWSFIAWMTALIVAWVTYNVFAPEGWRPDEWPFLFLILLLSLQASYAAPLILLAQNRQADRDRVQYVEDRDRAERLVADTEYLMREIATLRTALGEVATRDFIRGEFKELLIELPQELARQSPIADHQADSSKSEIASNRIPKHKKPKRKKTGPQDDS